jgi:2'-5' RNA ligase
LRAAQVDALIELVRELEFPRVELVLDRLGFWPRPRIVWLGCRVVPDTLKAFEGRLRRGLVQLGLVTERRAFSPHITLFRKVTRRPRLKLTPLQWSVDGLCVVRSVLGPTGARYQVLQHTPGTSIL